MMTPDGCLSRGPIYNTEYLIGRAAGNRPPPSAAHLQKRNAIVSHTLIFLVKSSIAFLFSLRATLIVTSYNRPPAFFFLLFVPLSYPPLCRPSHHPPCVPV